MHTISALIRSVGHCPVIDYEGRKCKDAMHLSSGQVSLEAVFGVWGFLSGFCMKCGKRLVPEEIYEQRLWLDKRYVIIALPDTVERYKVSCADCGREHIIGVASDFAMERWFRTAANPPTILVWPKSDSTTLPAKSLAQFTTD